MDKRVIGVCLLHPTTSASTSQDSCYLWLFISIVINNVMLHFLGLGGVCVLTLGEQDTTADWSLLCIQGRLPGLTYASCPSQVLFMMISCTSMEL